MKILQNRMKHSSILRFVQAFTPAKKPDFTHESEDLLPPFQVCLNDILIQAAVVSVGGKTKQGHLDLSDSYSRVHLCLTQT